jgi:hypothetical protein
MGDIGRLVRGSEETTHAIGHHKYTSDEFALVTHISGARVVEFTFFNEYDGYNTWLSHEVGISSSYEVVVYLALINMKAIDPITVLTSFTSARDMLTRNQ